MPDQLVNVRYMVDDVERAVDFYTAHFGFDVRNPGFWASSLAVIARHIDDFDALAAGRPPSDLDQRRT